MDIEKRVMEKMGKSYASSPECPRCPMLREMATELVILEAKCENLLYLVGELMGPEIFPVWPEDIRGMERKKNG